MWNLWQHAELLKELTDIEPRLASWERSDHPSQIRLRMYLEDLTSRLTPIPDVGPLFLDLTVDVNDPSRLLHQYDLENYLTPLFGTDRLPRDRFVCVTARKQVGGGSSIRIGHTGTRPADDEKARPWSHLTVHAGSGASTKEWKQRIHNALASTQTAALDDGPVEVRLAWRCSPQRNWITLWKPTGDAMGPILGLAGTSNPFHPRDDRIVELDLHFFSDENAGNDVEVGIWWRHQESGFQSAVPKSSKNLPSNDIHVPDVKTEHELSSTITDGVVLFENNDEVYLRWIAGNPHGYVVNTPRNLSPSYMVLHRASCSSVTSYTEMAKAGGFTERQYVKVCSSNVRDLREWVRAHGRADASFSAECGLCKP